MPVAMTDHLVAFLTAYDEYLDGKRDYRDLPEAFGMCPPEADCAACLTSPPRRQNFLALNRT